MRGERSTKIEFEWLRKLIAVIAKRYGSQYEHSEVFSPVIHWSLIIHVDHAVSGIETRQRESIEEIYDISVYCLDIKPLHEVK